MNTLIGKFKEVHDDIIVLCDCGTSDHHLRITKWRDNDLHDDDFYAVIVPCGWSLWLRIKTAWKMIWDGPQAEEVIIPSKQMRELINTLNDILIKEEITQHKKPQKQKEHSVADILDGIK